MNTSTTKLSAAESERLKNAQTVIKQLFVSQNKLSLIIGLCLHEIQQQKLYRETHRDFKVYVQELHEINPRNALRLINAAQSFLKIKAYAENAGINHTSYSGIGDQLVTNTHTINSGISDQLVTNIHTVNSGISDQLVTNVHTKKSGIEHKYLDYIQQQLITDAPTPATESQYRALFESCPEEDKIAEAWFYVLDRALSRSAKITAQFIKSSLDERYATEPPAELLAREIDVSTVMPYQPATKFYLKITNSLFDYGIANHIGPASLSVLLAILRIGSSVINKGIQEVVCSHQQIEAITSYSHSTISAAIKTLETFGFLSVNRQTKTRNAYSLKDIEQLIKLHQWQRVVAPNAEAEEPSNVTNINPATKRPRGGLNHQSQTDEEIREEGRRLGWNV